MQQLPWLRTVALLSLIATVGCGGNPRPQVPAATPAVSQVPASTAAPPPAPQDPVSKLIAESERHFARGRAELEAGHLEKARLEFDRALDLLIDSPYGARSEPRLRDHFDRLVDRITAHEVTALAAGDGFTETGHVPASIDELLAVSTFATPEKPTAEVTEAVRADLAATVHDIPIPLNDKVLRYVELFQGRLRGWIENGLTRGAQYLPMIQDVFRAEGLPLDLAYVPLIESSFKPKALSRASAKGVWQFMKGTAIENGLRHDWYIDERADPEKATRAAAKYLKTLHRMFDGDWHLALASYNGGPGRVQRAMKRSRQDDFWSLTTTSAYLPRETREYVPMILAAIIVARNPVQYGFAIEAAAPVAYDRVQVPRAVDLRRVAEWAGTSIDAIQELNPELRRWTTPAGYPDYEVKVPAGKGDAVRAQLATAPTEEFTAFKWHTVRRGETLATVARRFGVTRVDLAEANAVSSRSRLRAGQRLMIPRAPAPVMAARLDRPAPATTVVAASRDVSGTSASVSPASAGGRDVARLVHRVRRGDTLIRIARLYSTTVAQLKRWNSLRSNNIRPGDRLTVYRRR
jgi:membrane-bound lytic murein transglycosylase D